jgi:flagellar hook-length control protein FliK
LKGGEILELNALGYVQTIRAKTTKTASHIDGNKGLFNSLLNDSIANKSVKTDTTEIQSEKLAGTELNELIEFMSSFDLLEVEGGRELLDQVISNADADLLQLVKEYFGFSDQKWSDILQTMSGLQSSKPVSEELDTNSKSEIDMIQMEMMISSLYSLPQKEFINTVTDDTQAFMKAAKLFELLASNQDNNQNSQLKGLIKQIAEKLEVLSPDSKSSIKFELLQKTFSPLAMELNKKMTLENNQSEKFPEPIGLKKQLAERLETISNDKKSSAKLELLQTISKNDALSEPMAKAVSKFEVLQGTTFLAQQVSKPEQITMMSEGSRKPVSGEQLMQQFEAILAKSSFIKAGGSQRLLIRLNPEHLGSLRIELIQKEQGMIARILTSTATAKETLDTQLNGLKQAFAAQGIPVEKIEITQQMSQHERNLNREQSQQQEQQQQQQQHNQNQEMEKRQKNDEFTLTFEEALLNMEV